MGDILHRHKDRFSCEISTTMNLGGDEWFNLFRDEKCGYALDDGFYNKTDNKGTKVILKAGDMLVYKGMILEHWREAFIGKDCCRCFYTIIIKTQKTAMIIYLMVHLGLPSYFKGLKL